jgi:hypothetical protein
VKNLKIVVRQARPSSNSDFITTDGSGRRDVAGFFGNSSARIAEDSFYTGDSKINMGLGGNVYIQGSAGALATIVHLK